MNKCHICDFSDESEENLRGHMLFDHSFWMPICSTDAAYQANSDFNRMRETRIRWMKELSSMREWITRKMIDGSKLKEFENAIRLHECFIINEGLHVIVHKGKNKTQEKIKHVTNHHVKNYISKYYSLDSLSRKMKEDGVLF